MIGATYKKTPPALAARSRGPQVVSCARGAHLWHDGPSTRSLTNIGETRFITMLGDWR